MSNNSGTSSRYSQRLNFPFLVWMVAFVVLVCGIGVTFAVLKNEQVAVRTEISKLQRETNVYRMNANQYRAKTNALTNRWAMRDRLSQDGSTLRDIERSQIEIARNRRDAERMSSTASR